MMVMMMMVMMMMNDDARDADPNGDGGADPPNSLERIRACRIITTNDAFPPWPSPATTSREGTAATSTTRVVATPPR